MQAPPSDTPHAWLARLAQQSAAAWHALGSQSFPGESSVETANGVYRFRNGVFLSRARRPSRSFDAPKELRGVRLIGFLADEGGFWSLSPRFREGAHCVLWKPDPAGECDPRSFVLTSPCLSIATDDPEPMPWSRPSGVRTRHIARPPTYREPEPPSMTRLHPVLTSAP
ncbi:MAG TPA: hypothetical protein VIF62_06485 [Labilithrix sp.]|jgi:hypothetical protein